MTKDEMIELAKQAGMNYRNFEDEFYSGNTDGVSIEHLEVFAKLAVETEREACALIAEIESFRELPKQKPKGKLLLTAITQIMCGTIIAQIIRERGQK